jgi:hypothetical protein
VSRTPRIARDAPPFFVRRARADLARRRLLGRLETLAQHRAGSLPNPDNVADRIDAAGLPSSSTESLTVHYHSHVDIFVNGKSEPVASSIGREDQSLFSPFHTHATSGLIHIEAPEDQDFTVGMLFTEWGVRLTNDCIGGYRSPDTKLKAYLDGTAYTQLISTIVLKKGEEIAIVIGSPPPTIPSSWDCLANIDPTIENPAQCADFGQQVPA